MSTIKRLLGAAENTTPGYHFETGDTVVKFPSKLDDMLAKQAEIERLIVDTEGEFQFVMKHYNELIEHHNELLSRIATKLAEHGIRATPVLKPKKDFMAPPPIPGDDA